MNRRQFLASSAAGILSLPALLRGAGAQEGPFRIKYYPVAAGIGSRDVTPAPDGTIWFCGQRNGTLGRLDPRDGSYKLVDLGKGAAPPWRHYRTRRRAVGDRGRTECDRAR